MSGIALNWVNQIGLFNGILKSIRINNFRTVVYQLRWCTVADLWIFHCLIWLTSRGKEVNGKLNERNNISKSVTVKQNVSGKNSVVPQLCEVVQQGLRGRQHAQMVKVAARVIWGNWEKSGDRLVKNIMSKQGYARKWASQIKKFSIKNVIMKYHTI